MTPAERASSVVRGQEDGLLAEVAGLCSALQEADPQEVLSRAVEGLRGLVEADIVAISTAEGADQVTRAVAAGHGPAPRVGDRVPVGHSVAGEALRSREVLVTGDAEADGRSAVPVGERFGVRSGLMVPLLVAGEPHGLLIVLSRARDAFCPRVVDVARLVGSAVAGRLAQAVASDEQDSLLGAVFESLDEGIVVRSWHDGEVVLLNAAAERIVGRQGVLGSALRQGWTWTDEDGAVVPPSALPTSVVLRTGRAVRDRLLRAERPDGGRSWLELTALPVSNSSGEVTSVVTRVADVTERIDARRALEASRRRLAAATEVTGLAWWDYDIRADRHTWSEAMFDLLGLPRGQVPTTAGLFRMVHPEDREHADPAGRLTEGTSVFRLRRPDGALRFLQCWTEAVRDDAGAVVSLHGSALDVTQREQAARAMADSEATFRATFDGAPTGMAIVSLGDGRVGRVLRVNEALTEMLGTTGEAMVGTAVPDWVEPEQVERAMRDLRSLAASEDVSALNLVLRRPDGEPVHVLIRSAVMPSETEGERSVLVHVMDVTEQRRAAESLVRMAMTDGLTGLANRSRLVERMNRALRRLQGHNEKAVAVLLLDLDRFKLVNDGLGHPVGDALLVAVARRLLDAVPDASCVSRLGGDEFVVLLERATFEEAHELAEAIVATLREPYDLPSGHRVVTSASVGISLARSRRRDGSDLLREADLALYRAKDSGRDRVAVCDDALRAAAVARVDVENTLRAALDSDRLRLHLQPIVDLPTAQATGAEALVRAVTDDGVLLPPGLFIQVAEETGLVARVDRWMVRRAVSLLADPDRDLPSVAVNVSGRTLAEPGFAELVLGALAEHGVAGSRLDVEITESVLLEATLEVREALGALRDAGVRVGLDDFGTGYSSLAYLQRLPLDFLKIDRSFVARLGVEDAAAEATVRAIVDVAHAHGLQVTAEGVETSEQARMLLATGCDHGQGWLYGRPEPS